MMKYTVYLFILLVGLVTTSWAQEDMSLPKAISIGLENNYGIKIDDINIQIADNNNTWARAGKGPIIDLNAGFNNVVVNDNNPASFLQGTYYSGSLSPSLSAQWVVINGGRTKILKEQLGVRADSERLTKDQNIHNLMRDIHLAYYNVIFQKEQLVVFQNSLSLSKDRLKYEQTKREYGSSNAYNLVQFENAVISDSSNVLSQAQLVETAKRQLYNTLDIKGYPDYKYPENLSVSIEAISEEKLEDILTEENPTLKGLMGLAGLNRLNTQLAEAALKPTLSLNGSFGYARNGFKFYADNPQTGEPFEFISSNRWNGNIGANLTWNLYDGGSKNIDIENAQLQEELDQLSILESRAELSNQLQILIANYRNQEKLLQLSDQGLEVSEKNLEMSEERFKAGVITSLDYRTVQSQYLGAAFSKIVGIYNLIVTKTEIDWLVGTFEK